MTHVKIWLLLTVLQFKVKRVMPLFKHLYLNAIAKFIFNQSSMHGAFAKNVLNAKEMNVQPDGKQKRCMTHIFLWTIPGQNFMKQYSQ